MTLQIAGVVVLVSGAVIYLLWRLVGRRARRGAGSFVPVASLKRGPRSGCH